MKLEQFEQEYRNEIEQIKSLRFRDVERKEFKYPAYQFLYKKVYAFAFAMPAMVVAFAFFFYTGGEKSDSNLAMLEDSNTRILQEINSLDN